MFTAINHQLKFVSNRLIGEVLMEVFKVCRDRLLNQQKEQHTEIDNIISSGDPESQVP